MAVGYGNVLRKIVTNDLVFCVDAGNSGSYPGSGTTWRDLSGLGNNGTLTNGPTFSSVNGGAIVFDGSNDYVETNFIPTSAASFTLSFWAKSTVASSTNRPIGNADSTAGLSGTSLIWGLNGNDIYFVRRNGSNDGNRDISYVLPGLTTQIFYIIGTYDTSVGSKLYVNGSQVAQNSNLGYTSSLPLRIGRDGNGTDAFNGSVYNAQFYNRALTAAEILQNFNALRGRYGI